MINNDTGIIIDGFKIQQYLKSFKKYIEIPKIKKLDMIYQAKLNLNQKLNSENIIKSWVEIV